MPGKPKSKSIETLVKNYGFSLNAIKIIQVVIPDRPLSEAVRMAAHYLLNGESREELRFQQTGVVALEKHFNQPILVTRAKPYKINLPGGTYTPDYLCILADGMRVLVETKGSPFQHGYEAAMLRLRASATLCWFDTFVKAIFEKGEWRIEVIPPDKEYETELQSLADAMQETLDGDGGL